MPLNSTALSANRIQIEPDSIALKSELYYSPLYGLLSIGGSFMTADNLQFYFNSRLIGSYSELGQDADGLSGIDIESGIMGKNVYARLIYEQLNAPASLWQPLDDSRSIGFGFGGSTQLHPFVNNDSALRFSGALATVFHTEGEGILDNLGAPYKNSMQFVLIRPQVIEELTVPLGPFYLDLGAEQTFFAPLMFSKDDIDNYTLASFLAENRSFIEVGYADRLAQGLFGYARIELTHLLATNDFDGAIQNAETGATMGIKKNGILDFTLEANYRLPLFRALHAGDAIAIGRDHQTALSASIGNERFSASLTGVYEIKDRDDDAYARPNQSILATEVRTNFGPVTVGIGGQVAQDVQWGAGLTLSVNDENSTETIDDRLQQIHNKQNPDPAMVKFPDVQDEKLYKSSSDIDDLWESSEYRLAIPRRELIDRRVDKVLLRDDLNIKGKIAELGNFADEYDLTLIERMYTIYVASQMIQDRPDRYNIDMQELIGFAADYSKDPLGFIVDFLRDSSYPADKIKSTYVNSAGGVTKKVFVQLEDGKWMAFDSNRIFGPYEAKDYDDAVRQFSPFAPAAGAHDSMTYSPQWQKWYGLTDRLLWNERD